MAKKSKDTVEDTSVETETQEVSVESEVIDNPTPVEVKELPTVVTKLPDDVKINGKGVVRGKSTFYF
jgi:hypothetical protein